MGPRLQKNGIISWEPSFIAMCPTPNAPASMASHQDGMCSLFLLAKDLVTARKTVSNTVAWLIEVFDLSIQG